MLSKYSSRDDKSFTTNLMIKITKSVAINMHTLTVDARIPDATVDKREIGSMGDANSKYTTIVIIKINYKILYFFNAIKYYHNVNR